MPEDAMVPVKQGQHYEHKRGQIYTVEYLNEQIVLLFDGKNYRLERREHFESEIQSGMYELRDDKEIYDSEIEISFEEIDWVGEQAQKSLRKAGLTTPKQFDYWTDERITELDSVGHKSVSNIREWIDNNVTKTVEI